tara:strand:+ start:812 stop:1717 length:906 start_codon:yes stop_codon:yes gene_type:complete
MSLDIPALYKKIISINNPTTLEHQVPAAKQREYIELLIEYLTPKQDAKIILMITKLYIHFVSNGASAEVRDDAFTSMMILKSFSCKQQLEDIQELLFSFYFNLLYSRHLTPQQKQETMLEFAEFGRSNFNSILARFICFYFDTQSNADFNLFKHEKNAVSHETIANICRTFTEIIKGTINEFPQLKPQFAPLTHDTILQRFYNQFVYGDWGLKASPYDSNRTKTIADCLINCAQHDVQSAKKALIKCTDYLINQQQAAESANNADYLILLDQDVTYIIAQAKDISFEKLHSQWDKVIKKLV